MFAKEIGKVAVMKLKLTGLGEEQYDFTLSIGRGRRRMAEIMGGWCSVLPICLGGRIRVAGKFCTYLRSKAQKG